MREWRIPNDLGEREHQNREAAVTPVLAGVTLVPAGVTPVLAEVIFYSHLPAAPWIQVSALDLFPATLIHFKPSLFFTMVFLIVSFSYLFCFEQCFLAEADHLAVGVIAEGLITCTLGAGHLAQLWHREPVLAQKQGIAAHLSKLHRQSQENFPSVLLCLWLVAAQSFKTKAFQLWSWHTHVTCHHSCAPLFLRPSLSSFHHFLTSQGVWSSLVALQAKKILPEAANVALLQGMLQGCCTHPSPLQCHFPPVSFLSRHPQHTPRVWAAPSTPKGEGLTKDLATERLGSSSSATEFFWNVLLFVPFVRTLL